MLGIPVIARHQTELLGRRLSAAGTFGGPISLGLGGRPELALEPLGSWVTLGVRSQRTYADAAR
jgi:hypothetical protein